MAKIYPDKKHYFESKVYNTLDINAKEVYIETWNINSWNGSHNYKEFTLT